jgi:ribosomal protein S18 acetylase RimI-like enzyme
VPPVTRAPTLDVLDAHGFAPYVDAAVEVYVVAMGKRRDVLPARRDITRRHLDFPGFRGVVALSEGRLAAFSYGYLGRPGQWWHDSVVGALPRTDADTWLDNAFEVAELHVLPAWQGRGLGRALLHAVCADTTAQTVVLSAIDAETPARQLYRSAGFRELLTGFTFPGSAERYAVMGRSLPLDDGG